MKKPIEAVIEDVVIQPNKIQPIIVNFQNGHLKDEETKRMKCGLYNDDKKKKTVLAMSNGQVVYKGYRPDLNKELTYTMLAIHNKKTGKVRLIQAERWDVAPVLDQHVDDANDEDEDQVVALNKQFGSKKAKRRTEQYEKMKVNVDSVLKEQLEKTVSSVQIERQDLEPIAKDDFVDGLHLPPCNRDATQVSLVYNVEDIVPKSILETLYDRATELLGEEVKDKPDFYSKTIQKVKGDPTATEKVAMLLYIEAVSCWLNVPIKLSKKSDLNVCPDSADVHTYVIDTYSLASTNGRQRPNSMRDKGLIHCIILGLVIWNFKLNLEMFSTMFSFRLGLKKLVDLARWIHAVPAKDDKNTVILKVPLPAQPSKPMQRKKK